MDDWEQDQDVDGQPFAGVTAFARSEMFARIYDDAMQMVRDAADYLELDGQIDRNAMPDDLAPVYACESMRLTTRLMQVSAWLLAMRAVQEGELSGNDVKGSRYRLGAAEVCLGGPVRGAGLLPAQLIDLLGTSRRLYERVARLDGLLFDDVTGDSNANPVDQHLNRLAQAFNRKEE
jgi:regulator of CtrA degradation